jgi:tight adherence protein C
MLTAIAILVFLAIAAAVVPGLMGPASRLSELGALLPYREAEGEGAVLPLAMGRSLWERAGVGPWTALTRLVGRLAPARTLERTRFRLEQAGRPHGVTAPGYLALQALLALAALVGMVLLARGHHLPQRLIATLVLGAPLVATMIPNWFIDRLADARRKAIRSVLPDAIDILVVSVEAGLSLDGSVQEFVNRDRSPLSDELARAQAEIRAGRSRDAAWRDMAARGGVSELATFVSAICQGERLGASIAHILHTHAEAMRIRRSLYARELAAKIPVKMLFPMIFFIFPCLFVVMLGPGVIMIIHNFKGFM